MKAAAGRRTAAAADERRLPIGLIRTVSMNAARG
jgi:hypothetical protein